MKQLHIDNESTIQVGSAALFQTDEPGKHVSRIQGPYEILFTRRGYLGIEEDGREFVVGQNQAILIFPGARIRGTLPFPPTMLLNFVHFDITQPSEPGEAIAIPQYVAVRRPARLATLFHLLIEEQHESGIHGPAQEKLTRLILHEMATSRPPENLNPQRSGPQFLADRVANWIAEHAAEDISTRDVAAALSHHPNYLSRVFREHHGHTIVEHIHSRRIELARQQLITNARPIQQVALSCGFNEEGYFRRVFRRHTGMTPRAFRAAYSPAPTVGPN